MVTYDGVSYPCTAYAFNGLDNYPCVGNSSLGLIDSAVTEEPFLMVHMGKYWVHYTAQPGEHTCVIEMYETVIVPLE